MSILRSAPRDTVDAPAATFARWKPALGLIGVAILIFAVGFHSEASTAVRAWIETTAYNHCFLVLPVVGYLLWERRSVIRAAMPNPVLWPLALMPFLSAAWLVAAALDVNEGRQLLVVAMFEVMLVAALGAQLYRLLLAPLLFLFFLVPSGEFLIPPLQSTTTAIAVAGLRLLHIPVFADGNVIDIPEGSFAVAEACAGLRFLIAAVVFGCLFAVVMYRSWLRRGVYVALSIPTAIAANGLRVLGILVLAHLWGNATAVEADHILYGYVFLSLVIALLIGIGLLLAKGDREPVWMLPAPTGRAASWWRTAAVPLAALLAVSGPGYAAWRNSLVQASPLPQIRSPGVAAPWRVDAGLVRDWQPVVQGADREFLESFSGPNSTVVTRYVALYRLHLTGNRLTSAENRIANEDEWRFVRQSRARLLLAGKPVSVASAEILRGVRRRLVWSFYVVDGGIAAGLFEAKLLQLRAAWGQREPLGAFVAVAASMDDPDQPAAEQLARFLAASQSLPDYVAALSRQHAAAVGSQWRAAATAP
jgi:exosortase A